MLTGIDSLSITQTPPSDTTSEFEKTPGKRQLALPAPETSSFKMDTDYVEDREMIFD